MGKSLLLALLLAGLAAADEPEPVNGAAEKTMAQAEKAYGEKNYHRALMLYLKLVEDGNAEAMAEVGGMYADGNGVAQDYAKAKKWYELAFANGNRYYDLMGELYEKGGPGLAQDYGEAKKWYEKYIAANGYYTHNGWIGRLYEKGGPGLAKDLDMACASYKKAGPVWHQEAERTCLDNN